MVWSVCKLVVVVLEHMVAGSLFRVLSATVSWKFTWQIYPRMK